MMRWVAGILSSAVIWSNASVALAEDRPLVAVFDVENQGAKLDGSTLDRLTSYIDSLLAERGFQMVPRSELKARLGSRKKESYQQCYDQSCQIEIGKELAAQKTLSTRILKLGKSCKVTLTLYDLKKSASEGGATESSSCDESAIVTAIERAVGKLVGEMPPAPGEAGSPLTWLQSAPAKIELTRSEVTVAQYRACVGAGKCTPSHLDDELCYVYDGKDWRPGKLAASFRGEDQPVVCVDWAQADGYCAWAGGRLPTAAEWTAEASNGGKRRYPWGEAEATCDRAVMNQGGGGCGRDATWPVCSRKRGDSVSGLCDLGGNVWEWTSSRAGTDRILLGGSWEGSDPGDLRTTTAAERSGGSPTAKVDRIGFRCARDARK